MYVQRAGARAREPGESRACICCDGVGGAGSLRPTFSCSLAKPAEMRVAGSLLSTGGVLRFYRGYTPRLLMVCVNGALFNMAFVACRNWLRVVWPDVAQLGGGDEALLR